MTDKKHEIELRLRQVEQQRGVKIIYAAESGSRAWGLASPDSDYDVRFVYVQPREEYLRIDEQPDFIEWQLDAVYDINGWDLKKTLSQIASGNATVFEWMNSPVVYRTSQQWENMCPVFRQYFSQKAAVRHYFGIAVKTFTKYLQDEKVRYKKYFYALRPLLAARYIENRHGEPPVLFEQLEGELPAELRETVGRLLEIKRQTAESEKLPAIAPISAFIKKELEFQREMLAKLPDDRNPDYSGLNGILRGTVLGTQADVSR